MLTLHCSDWQMTQTWGWTCPRSRTGNPDIDLCREAWVGLGEGTGIIPYGEESIAWSNWAALELCVPKEKKIKDERRRERGREGDWTQVFTEGRHVQAETRTGVGAACRSRRDFRNVSTNQGTKGPKQWHEAGGVLLTLQFLPLPASEAESTHMTVISSHHSYSCYSCPGIECICYTQCRVVDSSPNGDIYVPHLSLRERYERGAGKTVRARGQGICWETASPDNVRRYWHQSTKSHQHVCPNMNWTRMTPTDMPK